MPATLPYARRVGYSVYTTSQNTQIQVISWLGFLAKSLKLVAMPVILRERGFKLLIYSNEHPPAHIDVIKGDGEAVFELVPKVGLRESLGMKVNELRWAEYLVKKHETGSLGSWNGHINRQGQTR